MRTRNWVKEWMGMVNDGRLKVGAHPLLIPNAKGRSQSLGARSIEIEGGSKDPVIHVWQGTYPTGRPHLRSAADSTL